jgi:hypothetical protein
LAAGAGAALRWSALTITPKYQARRATGSVHNEGDLRIHRLAGHYAYPADQNVNQRIGVPRTA